MMKPDPNHPDGCHAPMPGEIFKNPNLANIFRTLANVRVISLDDSRQVSSMEFNG
jgi:hypothetical protein